MKFPFLVLTYGEFTRSKKLFIYEKDGQLILPIFSDIENAMEFAESIDPLLTPAPVSNTTNKNEENRQLMPHVCVSKSMTIDMLKVVSSFFGVNIVVADPGDIDEEYTFEQLIDQLSEESSDDSI
jgi:hypothetical protein